jgi:uncharacterized membrane protein
MQLELYNICLKLCTIYLAPLTLLVIYLEFKLKLLFEIEAVMLSIISTIKINAYTVPYKRCEYLK